MTTTETTTTATATAISRTIRDAAALISQAGYTPIPTGGEPGYSADTALCAASGCGPVADGQGHLPVCDAVHARVAGYLFLTGKVTGHRPGYLPGVVERWETYEPGEGHRAAADVLAVLTHAASILGSATSQSPANGAVSSPFARVVAWCGGQNLPVDGTVTEIGSALNGRRKKFLRLLGDQAVTTIVVEHRDRFARFGAEYVEAALAASGRRLLVADPAEVDDDLVRDVTEILTSLCARLYGRRAAPDRAARALAAMEASDA